MNKNFLKIRSQLKMSQSQLARAIGNDLICKQAISSYERGVRTPSLNVARQLIRVAKEHGIILTLDDVFKGFPATK